MKVFNKYINILYNIYLGVAVILHILQYHRASARNADKRNFILALE